MNKYEQAYYRIKSEVIMQCPAYTINPVKNEFGCACSKVEPCGKVEHCQYYKDLQLLKELVDKATPKKPYHGVWGYRCPTCNSHKVYDYEYNNEFDYCSGCGQRLDWGDVDE